MNLDIYQCTFCNEEFGVKKEKEPQLCPFCQGEVRKSHSTEEEE